MIGVTEPFGVSLSFAYDSSGNRVLVQDSFGGATQSTYDAANQLVSELFTQQGMPTLRIDQTYNADGEVASQTRYSDAAVQNVVATSDYTYDFNGDQTQIIHKSATGAVLAEYDYTYDPAGDLVSETDNGVTTKYQYDATGQLVGYGTTTQSYDANGNRNGSGDIVGPDNQLLSDGTWDYTYDAEGNEATKTNIATGEKWTYGYDNMNELISAVENAAGGNLEVQADYKYDVFGNRIEKDVWTPATGTVVTKYAYDAWNPNVPSGVGNENWNVWADLDANDNLVTRYFRGDALDQIFGEMGAGGSVAWYLTDNVGSTRVLVDNSGNVLDEINYDAFGNITSQTNAVAEPQYMYTGQAWDVETGLQYSRARYYDPASGRWISQDPMAFHAGDSNLYRYVANKPLAASDPSGLEGDSLPDLFGRVLKGRNKMIDDLAKAGNGTPKGTRDFVQGKWVNPSWERDAALLSQISLKLLDVFINSLQPAVQFKKFAVDGFLGSAWHTATHPWEIVTGPVNAVLHPVDTFKGAVAAFKEDPAKAIGSVAFGIVLSKSLGALGAGKLGKVLEAAGGGCFVASTTVLLDEAEDAEQGEQFPKWPIVFLALGALVLARSGWGRQDEVRRRRPRHLRLGVQMEGSHHDALWEAETSGRLPFFRR